MVDPPLEFEPNIRAHQHAPPGEQALHDIRSVQAVHAIRSNHPVLDAEGFAPGAGVVETLLYELAVDDRQELVKVFPVHVAALSGGGGGGGVKRGEGEEEDRKNGVLHRFLSCRALLAVSNILLSLHICTTGI